MKELKLIAIVGKNILKSILLHPFEIIFKEGDLGYSYLETVGSKIKGQIVINDGTHEIFEGLKINEKLLAILGVIIHESLHLLLTSFSVFKTAIERLPAQKRKLYKTVFNIFEDTRIEYFASVYYGNKALNALYFMKQLSYNKAPNLEETEGDLNQIINASIMYGDYANIKGHFTSKKAEEDFLKITEWHDEAMRSRSCLDCLNLAFKAASYLWDRYLDEEFESYKKFVEGIYTGGLGEDAKPTSGDDVDGRDEKRKAVKKAIKEKLSKDDSGKGDSDKDSDEKDDDSDSEGSEGSGDSEEDKSDDKSKSKSKESRSGDSGEESSGESKGKKKDIPVMSGSSKGEKSSGKRSAVAGGDDDATGSPGGSRSKSSSDFEATDGIITEEDVEEAIEELKVDLEKAEKEIAEESSSSIETDETVEEVSDAFCKRIVRRYMNGNEEEYARICEAHDIIGASETLIHDIKNIFKSKPDGWKMSDRGNINAKRWKDPNFVDPRVFDRRITRKQDIAIMIAVDESGSMHSRVTQARASAIMLSETLTALGIPYSIVGYSADEDRTFDVDLRYYVNWDSTAHDKTSLVYLSARCQNRDGPTIRVLSDELAKRNEKHKLLIVLSDGAPEACSGYSGSRAIADTEGAIVDAKRKMNVIGISMQTRDAEIIASMYGNDFIECKTMAELSETLGELLKDVVRKW